MATKSFTRGQTKPSFSSSEFKRRGGDVSRFTEESVQRAIAEGRLIVSQEEPTYEPNLSTELSPTGMAAVVGKEQTIIPVTKEGRAIYSTPLKYGGVTYGYSVKGYEQPQPVFAPKGATPTEISAQQSLLPEYRYGQNIGYTKPKDTRPEIKGKEALSLSGQQIKEGWKAGSLAQIGGGLRGGLSAGLLFAGEKVSRKTGETYFQPTTKAGLALQKAQRQFEDAYFYYEKVGSGEGGRRAKDIFRAVPGLGGENLFQRGARFTLAVPGRLTGSLTNIVLFKPTAVAAGSLAGSQKLQREIPKEILEVGSFTIGSKILEKSLIGGYGLYKAKAPVKFQERLSYAGGKAVKLADVAAEYLPRFKKGIKTEEPLYSPTRTYLKGKERLSDETFLLKASQESEAVQSRKLVFTLGKAAGGKEIDIPLRPIVSKSVNELVIKTGRIKEGIVTYEKAQNVLVSGGKATTEYGNVILKGFELPQFTRPSKRLISQEPFYGASPTVPYKRTKGEIILEPKIISDAAKLNELTPDYRYGFTKKELTYLPDTLGRTNIRTDEIVIRSRLQGLFLKEGPTILSKAEIEATKAHELAHFLTAKGYGTLSGKQPGFILSSEYEPIGKALYEKTGINIGSSRFIKKNYPLLQREEERAVRLFEGFIQNPKEFEKISPEITGQIRSNIGSYLKERNKAENILIERKYPVIKTTYPSEGLPIKIVGEKPYTITLLKDYGIKLPKAEKSLVDLSISKAKVAGQERNFVNLLVKPAVVEKGRPIGRVIDEYGLQDIPGKPGKISRIYPRLKDIQNYYIQNFKIFEGKGIKYVKPRPTGRSGFDYLRGPQGQQQILEGGKVIQRQAKAGKAIPSIAGAIVYQRGFPEVPTQLAGGSRIKTILPPDYSYLDMGFKGTGQITTPKETERLTFNIGKQFQIRQPREREIRLNIPASRNIQRGLPVDIQQSKQGQIPLQLQQQDQLQIQAQLTPQLTRTSQLLKTPQIQVPRTPQIAEPFGKFPPFIIPKIPLFGAIGEGYLTSGGRAKRRERYQASLVGLISGLKLTGKVPKQLTGLEIRYPRNLLGDSSKGFFGQPRKRRKRR